MVQTWNIREVLLFKKPIYFRLLLLFENFFRHSIYFTWKSVTVILLTTILCEITNRYSYIKMFKLLLLFLGITYGSNNIGLDCDISRFDDFYLERCEQTFLTDFTTSCFQPNSICIENCPGFCLKNSNQSYYAYPCSSFYR